MPQPASTGSDLRSLLKLWLLPFLAWIIYIFLFGTLHISLGTHTVFGLYLPVRLARVSGPELAAASAEMPKALWIR